MISIILPTYNSIRFLEERMHTIFSQTLVDWECIVIDGQSTDGTWEYFLKLEENDKRFKLFQFPPKGVYDAWNKGIERCTAEYICIATSDDTMTSSFLEEMLDALQRNSECELAHCCLTVIDENSNPTENQWVNWSKVKFFGSKINEEHIRIAPHDGLVHAGWNTVYTSVTQLLIKKSLFDKIGDFSTNFGNIADFEWGMRAGFVANVVHVPKFLATWRKHGGQLTTDDSYFSSAPFFVRLVNMSTYSLNFLKSKGYKTPSINTFNKNYYTALLILSLKNNESKSMKYFFILFFINPVAAVEILILKLLRRKLSLKSKRYRPDLAVKKLIEDFC